MSRRRVRRQLALSGATAGPNRALWLRQGEPLDLQALDTRLRKLGVVNEEVVPVLYVEDADRAVGWYARLGFHKEWEHQFEPGFPRFVSVARGRVRLYLSEHKGDARPNTLIHVYVNDIDAVSEEFGIPVDEEGLAGRECALEDLDGNRLRVATRRS
jgi:catechol 2,3-dioxygenase-like lactoylglutathione lyase family enzyme